MNTMHETYPGHHVQFIRAAIDPTPETVKIGAKSVPLEEGTCIRTERAFTFIFAEDPFFPLFVAFRRHHASVRILVDLQLYYFGVTLEDAVKIYEEELSFLLWISLPSVPQLILQLIQFVHGIHWRHMADIQFL